MDKQVEVLLDIIDSATNQLKEVRKFYVKSQTDLTDFLQLGVVETELPKEGIIDLCRESCILLVNRLLIRECTECIIALGTIRNRLTEDPGYYDEQGSFLARKFLDDLEQEDILLAQYSLEEVKHESTRLHHKMQRILSEGRYHEIHREAFLTTAYGYGVACELTLIWLINKMSEVLDNLSTHELYGERPILPLDSKILRLIPLVQTYYRNRDEQLADKHARIGREKRAKEYFDYRQQLYDDYERDYEWGKKKIELDTAADILASGKSDRIVVKATGITEEELNQLKSGVTAEEIMRSQSVTNDAQH